MRSFTASYTVYGLYSEQEDRILLCAKEKASVEEQCAFMNNRHGGGFHVVDIQLTGLAA